MKDYKVDLKVTFIDLLTLLFIALKLCEVIDWSWWWVLAAKIIIVSLRLSQYILTNLLEKLQKYKEEYVDKEDDCKEDTIE
jgi:hypothetical protein